MNNSTQIPSTIQMDSGFRRQSGPWALPGNVATVELTDGFAPVSAEHVRLMIQHGWTVMAGEPWPVAGY